MKYNMLYDFWFSNYQVWIINNPLLRLLYFSTGETIEQCGVFKICVCSTTLNDLIWFFFTHEIPTVNIIDENYHIWNCPSLHNLNETYSASEVNVYCIDNTLKYIHIFGQFHVHSKGSTLVWPYYKYTISLLTLWINQPLQIQVPLLIHKLTLLLHFTRCCLGNFNDA